MLITRNPIYIFLKESCFKVTIFSVPSIFSFETEISTRVKKFEIEISLKRLLQQLYTPEKFVTYNIWNNFEPWNILKMQLHFGKFCFSTQF